MRGSNEKQGCDYASNDNNMPRHNGAHRPHVYSTYRGRDARCINCGKIKAAN